VQQETDVHETEYISNLRNMRRVSDRAPTNRGQAERLNGLSYEHQKSRHKGGSSSNSGIERTS
jgi:hypothetical protein